MKSPASLTMVLAISLLLLVPFPLPALEPYSFDQMGPACCFAGNKTEDPEALGGYARSDNWPKKIDAADPSLPDGAYLEITGASKEPFLGRFEGLEIGLVNNGKEKLVLPASDSRIQLFQEALDSDGQWKPVEFFPSSWCGNSYHDVFLEPGHYFSFVVPKYSGPVKTKLRFRLKEGSGAGELVSGEYDGGIHAEQLVRGEKPRRGARSIMDPTGE